MGDKAKIIIGIFTFTAFVLIGKMAQLQLFSPKYKEQAQKTTLGRNTLYPSRGLLYDRDGDLLVSNTTIYDCLLYTSPSPRDQRGSRMPSSA